jgi:C4-dicarboxylate-specific signal transduction histidine kinase
VRITARRDGPAAEVEVADSGPGIAPEHLPHLFEPFFTTKAPGQGAGLGLAVCHGIVASFGGAIAAESPPGGGARFRISLAAVPEGAAERG